jgi:hypothetical protein
LASRLLTRHYSYNSPHKLYLQRLHPIALMLAIIGFAVAFGIIAALRFRTSAS